MVPVVKPRGDGVGAEDKRDAFVCCLSPQSCRYLIPASIPLALRLAEAVAGWPPWSSHGVTGLKGATLSFMPLSVVVPVLDTGIHAAMAATDGEAPAEWTGVRPRGDGGECGVCSP